MENSSFVRKVAAAAEQGKERDYWLTKLSGELTKSTFPYDYSKKEAGKSVEDETGSMKNLEFVFPDDVYARLMKLGNQSDPRLHIILSAAVVLLLHKYNYNNNDIIVGAPILKQDTEAAFLNTVLVLRNRIDSSLNFKELILQVRQTIVEATEHVNYSLESLLYQLKIPYSEEDFPLFDTAILLENIHRKQDIQHLSPKIIFSFNRREDSISANIGYDSTLYKKETVEKIILHLSNLLENSIFDLDLPVMNIEILSDEEKERLLFDFNGMEKEYPTDKTIHELFEEQTGRTPGNRAIAGCPQHAALTYGELEKRANRLSRYLLDQGIGKGHLAAVLCDRSIEMVIAILGILKTGGAYIPVDPSLPQERIMHMLNDAAPGVVISQKKYIGTLNRLQWECPSFHTFICVDSRNIYDEEELQSELMDTKLWDYVAESATDEVSGGGWQSSYTGEFMTKEEMDEYGDNILEKLTPYLHKNMRVLEIGCASGIGMYRIAPRVGLFYGTDLSKEMIENNRKRVEQEGWQNIKLQCLPAHEIDSIKDEPFDLIIMNSVIQAFPGHNYLRKVIKKSIDMLSGKGFLFIGDVMDQDKKQALIDEMIEFKNSHDNENWKTKTDFSTELFVSRDFFRDLKLERSATAPYDATKRYSSHIKLRSKTRSSSNSSLERPSNSEDKESAPNPGVEKRAIQDIEFSGKIHTIENELTRFRYDAFFKIDKTRTGEDKGVSERKYKNQHDLNDLEKYSTEPVDHGTVSNSLAYVMFTSGTTGRPKGVPVRHRSFVNLIFRHREIFSEDSNCRMSQVAGPGFDAMAFEIWPCLTSGAALIIVDDETRGDAEKMKEWLIKNKITISFQSTMMAESLLQEKWPEKEVALRALRTAGDRLTKYPDAKYPFAFYNLYGPTEDTVWTTYRKVTGRVDGREFPDIGRPVGNHRVYILSRDNQLQPPGVPGELCIGGHGLAAGYLNRPELTAKNFVNNKSFLGVQGAIFQKSPLVAGGKIYKTGDLACWLPDGSIDFLGRIDFQVKIRGFRIEMGEIESLLLNHDDIEKAVVVAREDDNNEKYLCAYIVGARRAVPGEFPSTGGVPEGRGGLESQEPGAAPKRTVLQGTELREFLSWKLPDYMIPAYFVNLEELPVTANGKVNVKALPDFTIEAGDDYRAPENEIEEKLVEIWANVLNIDKANIGTTKNFFELGGHSLKATILVSRIHKEMDVKLPLAEIFRTPFIKDLAENIKNSTQDRFLSIEPVKPKDYYPLSAAQKRIFLVCQVEEKSLAYNVSAAMQLLGEVDIEKIENTFRLLIKRHESLRTFFVTVDGVPVQKIERPGDIDFKIEYIEAFNRQEEIGIREKHESSTEIPSQGGVPEGRGGLEAPNLDDLFKRFIRPFDLSKAPLMRAGIFNTGKGKDTNCFLVVDLHHIITDGTSMAVLVREFALLHSGKVLPPLRIQYKDFSEWQHRLLTSGKMKEQEDFWLQQFSGKIPVLDLPTDYNRPPIMDFAGNEIDFLIDAQETKELKKLALEEGATMYMLQLALFNILLAKISGQEDIVMGTPLAGRPHTNLELVIGMFLNTLALRNYPTGNKSFKEFLREIKKNTLRAFENQDFQFEELVEKLEIKREANRNPLFDVLFNYFNVDIQQQDLPDEEMPGLKMKPVVIETNSTRFDLIFKCQDAGEQLSLRILYRTGLFSAGTIERFIGYFREIASSVIADSEKKIKEIEILSPVERDEFICEFNEELEDE